MDYKAAGKRSAAPPQLFKHGLEEEAECLRAEAHSYSMAEKATEDDIPPVNERGVSYKHN